MLNKLSDYLFFRKLGKLFLISEKKRVKKLSPYSGIKNVLVVFNASDEDECQIIFSIVNELKESGKQIRVLGYVKWKQIPHYCFPKLAYDYITKKSSGFTGIPQNHFINEIIYTKYDMLIDFTTETIKPLFYVSALSCASLKVSRKKDNLAFFSQIYDIVISKKDLKHKDFFNEVIKYIHILKNN